MFRPSLDAAKFADGYRLGLSRDSSRGPAGARLGKGSGSSLEFQDRRDYAAGDDIRHIDWRTFARTNQLQIKLYREEISPRVEILVDNSRSMRTEESKAQRAIDLAALLGHVARADGFQVSVIALGDDIEVLPQDRFDASGLEFDSRAPLQEALRRARPLLRAGALRFVISDFLSPHDAQELVRPLSASAGGLTLMQVLSKADSSPQIGRALRLTDAETNETIELVLDSSSVKLYHDRLQKLQEALSEESRRAHGCLATVMSADAFAQDCSGTLMRLGVLEGA